LEEFFDARFFEGHKRFLYKLSHRQAATLFNTIESSISAGLAKEGMDFTFRETDRFNHEIIQKHCLNNAETLILFGQLGDYLRRRCLDSGLPVVLHEAEYTSKSA